MVRYDLTSDTKGQGNNLKKYQDEYIETNIDPFDSEITADMSNEIELEMAQTIYDMRREFKRQNKRLRGLYSSKAPREYKIEKPKRDNNIPKRRALA